MLKLENQLCLSGYAGLYDEIIGKEHILRKIKENIDFSFVNPMLKNSYCETFGRPAKEPEKMFKLLFLKSMYDLSDAKLMEEAMCNMSYKYFLDMNPEDRVPDESLMTKFRKTRIKSEELLEEMLKETIKQAIEKGLIKGTTIIADATHTKSKGQRETPTQILRRKSKDLRKEIYKTDYEASKYFPEKPSETAEIDTEIEYSKQLVSNLDEYIKTTENSKLKQKYNNLKELAESEKIKEIQSASDTDAKTGYKSEDNSFFGYKSHLAITEERLISAIEVTTGEAPDGKYLKDLIEQSKDNGISVKEVLADRAYSGSDNIEYANKEDIALISRLNPVISNAITKGEREDGFCYNKDAESYRCPAGHLSIRSEKKGTKKRQQIRYYFDVEKCKNCPMKDGCYKDGAKSKACSITISSEEHRSQFEFENSEYFKERIKERYKIEAKNAELKQAHGLDKCKYAGLFGMSIQIYTTAFVVNCKRIIRLLSNQNPNTVTC
jgi:IS5 family transposase